MNSEVYEAINTITRNQAEAESILALTKALQKRMEKLEYTCAERRACLTVIMKINRGRDEAITHLCEEDGGERERVQV